MKQLPGFPPNARPGGDPKRIQGMFTSLLVLVYANQVLWIAMGVFLIVVLIIVTLHGGSSH